MSKLRVYQLARELNRDNSEIIRELQHMGVPVTSHSNTVEDRLADQLRKKLGVYSGERAAVAVEAPPEEEHVEAAQEPKVEPKIEVKSEPVIEEPKIAEPAPVEAKPEAPAEPKIESKPAPAPPAPLAPVKEEKVTPAATAPPPPPIPPPAPSPPRYVGTRGVQFVEPRQPVS